MAKLRKIFSTIILLLSVSSLLLTTGCSDDSNEWGGLPDKVQHFLSQYFPEQEVSDSSQSNGSFRVKLKNSVAIVFNRNYTWTSVNGYGSTLPEIFLFDEFPPALYEYLTVTDNLKSVYSVTRDNTHYTVSLLNSTISYDKDTGEISPVVTGDPSSGI